MFKQALQVIREATKAVPAVRYALGIAGVMAAFALGASFFTDARVAFFATLAILALMVLLLVFARAATQGSTSVRGPATVLLWAITLLFVISCTLTVSSVFFGFPKPFPELVRELFTRTTEPETISGVPISEVADVILGIAPSETKSAQEALLRRTVADLSLPVPLMVGPQAPSSNCPSHRTVFLQAEKTLVKLQTFSLPSGPLRVRGLSDGQQNARLITGQSFVAVRGADGFRRIPRSVQYNGVTVYEFEAQAPSDFFIASYYPGLTAFTNRADEIGIEISDVCSKVDEVTLEFVGVPFETIDLRHTYEIPPRVSPPVLVSFPANRTELLGSAETGTRARFVDFIKFVGDSTSELSKAVVATWAIATDANTKDRLWTGLKYRDVTGDILVVAYGKAINPAGGGAESPGGVSASKPSN